MSIKERPGAEAGRQEYNKSPSGQPTSSEVGLHPQGTSIKSQDKNSIINLIDHNQPMIDAPQRTSKTAHV